MHPSHVPVLDPSALGALRSESGGAPHVPASSTSPVLLRQRAAALARAGELNDAWMLYRRAATATGGVLPTLPKLPCTICDHADSELCWVGTREDSILEDSIIEGWVRCSGCRTARRVVPPSPDRIAQARRARLAASPVSPSQLHACILDNDVIIERIRSVGYGLQWVNRAATAGRASMLVVGSGWGGMLASAEWRGFDVQGVEPDQTAAEWARSSLGVVVWESLLQVPTTPQDVIVLESGLGESTNPTRLLRALSRRLVSEGLLVLAVPCHDHPTHRMQGYDDPRWTAPDASIWFDRTGISIALLRANLQPLRSWHHPSRPGEILLLARKD